MPLLFTFMYIVFGMIVVAWAFTTPAGTTQLEMILKDSNIPEEFRPAVKTVLAMFMVLIWPIMVLQLPPK